MITFEFEGTEYQMMTEWDELTVVQYLNLMKVYQKNQIIPLGEEMLCQQLIEVLTGVDIGHFDEISVELLLDLMPKIANLSSTLDTFSEKKWPTPDFWEIDGIIYSYRKRYEECNAGEITDIKTFIGGKQYIWEYMLDVAAVLIRPAQRYTTPAGEILYKLEKRVASDHEINKTRVGNLRFVEIKSYVDFFLSGWFRLILTTNGYTKPEAEKIAEDLKSLNPSELLSYLTRLQKAT